MSNYQHTKYLPVTKDGTEHECAIVREFPNGEVAFIDLTSLDSIDLSRLARIVNRRDASNYQLWDLMSNVTLQNGENALEYFHQLTRILTPSGQVISPVVGVGGATGIRAKSEPAPVPAQSITGEDSNPSDTQMPPAEKRGPGRPPKDS